MKKLTNYIFAALLLLLTAGLQAQVVEVCAGDGTDSVTLSLAQYQYGNIQWQYSEDTLTWTDILGAHDTVFRCLPEQECYYRARIEYPNCPLDTTQVTHILFTPTANAGPDRILNEGYVTTLFGNKVEDGNTRCMWQVIEGELPDLEDPTYRNSRFTGPDTLYKLTWTVANACGVSVDTVEIRYVHTVMYDAIAIVDTTDIILSDSAERASGIYRIVFSNPAPNITDSTVLVGMVDEGFLRKVLYFEYYGDTCEMVTSQGYITDILKEGAINLEVPMSLAASSQRSGAYHTYTRAELLQDSRFLSGNWGALLDGLAQSYQRDLIVNNWNMGDVTLGGHWDIQDLTPDFSDVKLIEDWYVHPYLVFGNGYVSFKVGFMGDAKVDFKLHASQFATPFHITKDISPLTFGLPGLANVKLGVSLDFAVTLSANLSDGIEKQYIYTRPIYYVAEGEVLVAGGVPIPINIDFDTTKAGEGKIVEIEPEHINTNVSLELSLAIGPKLSGILLFKTLELYLEFMPKIAFVFCYGANGFKSESTDLRLYEEIGLKVIGLWNPNMFWEQTLKSWKRPYRMAMGPNTNRNLVPPAAGSWISDPIQVQVFKNNGDPRSGNTVLFEASDGVVSSTPSGSGSASAFATTNTNGIAQIYWKPNNTVAPTLKASVLDCEGNHIEGSPLWFYADNVCSNSTLTLDVRDGHLSPSGYNGAYGYLFLEYSSDNINWSNTAPYPLVPGTTYFVRDNNGCKATTTYTVQEATPACNLTTSTYQDGLQVRFVANNGTAPYHFYVDGLDYTTSGTTQRVFQHTFAQDGEYTLTVTDANGCTQSTVVRLLEGITPPTVVTIERYNTANQVYDAVMGAVTDNGGAEVAERGIQWSLSSDMSNATLVPSSITGDGLGRFVCQISDVSAGATYYARAYATNSKGPGYGNIITLTVPGTTPGPGSTTSCGVSSVRANETGSNGTITAVRDHQNNSYAVVQIGNQCWLKENMRCTTSPSTGANMVENPAVQANMSATVCRAYYYDNNPANAADGYGLLYNWPAAMDGSTAEGARGICPEGWHLPTDAEWTTLMNTAVSIYQPGVTPTSQTMANNARIEGGNTAISSMLSGGADWQSDNSGEATPGNFSHALRNATGFSAVPSGGYNGRFLGRGQGVYCWSSSPYDSGNASYRVLFYLYAGVFRDYGLKEYAFAVRCLRNDGGTSAAILPTVTTSAVENVTATSATCGGNVSSDGGAAVTARGVCWSTNQNPTISDNHTADGSGVGSFTSNISGLTAGNIYYVRAYATNSVGTAYGNEVSVTVPGNTPGPGNTTSCGVSSIHSNETGSNGTITAVRDHQNNSYAVVQIGNQCWLKENMRCTTSPSTGTYLIPPVGTDRTYTGKQARWYNNDSTTYAPQNYGLLYNWNAAMDTFNMVYGETSVNTDRSNVVLVNVTDNRRGVCPEGWHLPRVEEWEQLIDYISGQSQFLCGGDSTYVAKALASTEGWRQSSNTTCDVGNASSDNNTTGFSAVPAGWGWGSDDFVEAGWCSHFSSSTQGNNANSIVNAKGCELNSSMAYVRIYGNNKMFGKSVRCLRD